MVSLSPRVAKEVLRVVHLGKEETRRLTSRMDKPGKMTGMIRQSYLHFLMAFMVDKETNTIQLLMARDGKTQVLNIILVG